MGEPSSRNGLLSITETIGYERATRGIETSKYPEEKKTKVIPKVVASEIGRGQTNPWVGVEGLRDVRVHLEEMYGKTYRRT